MFYNRIYLTSSSCYEAVSYKAFVCIKKNSLFYLCHKRMDEVAELNFFETQNRNRTHFASVYRLFKPSFTITCKIDFVMICLSLFK